MAYYDLSGQVDKMFSIQRQGTISYNPEMYSLIETTSIFTKYRLTFPIDEVKSIRASIGARFDKHVPQGSEMFTLTQPIEIKNQFGGEIAYVYDDTRILDLNILEGSRSKVWAEYYLDTDRISFGTVGFDSRKYIRLYSNSMFQLDQTSSYICLEERIMYYLALEALRLILIPIFPTLTKLELPLYEGSQIMPEMEQMHS